MLALALLLATTAVLAAPSDQSEVRAAVQHIFNQLKNGQYEALYDALPASARTRLSRERLMLEKVTGTVAYVVIKTGGLLGTHHHYPVPWSGLKFDSVRQAFETTLTLDELQAGPCEFDDDTFDWGDRSRSYPHANYWTV